MNASPHPFKLFGVPFSVHTRKVIVSLRMKSLPYELVPVVPVAPETLPPNWQRLSPTGLIPVLEDDGFALADSTAIVSYLERRVPEPALLPSDPHEYGRALFVDSWAGSALFRDIVRPIFHAQIVEPKVRGSRDEASIERALEKAPHAFAYLESLEPGEFLVGLDLSIADLAVVSNLIMLHYLGRGIDRARYPKLATYFERRIASSPFREVLADERPFAEKMGLTFPEAR